MADRLFRFERLKVYERAVELSHYLHAIKNALPECLSDVQDMLDRHDLTITTKIARGTAEPTRKEAVTTFRVAARSAELCESVLARLRLCGSNAPSLEEAKALAGELHEALDEIAEKIQSGARARDVFRDA